MGLFENFPYANFHELNLDWILHELKELETEITNFVAINSVKYANPIVWDIASQYETNTVVLDSSGNAYLSVQPVPAGVALDREEYWTKIGNFSALWDSVRSAITPYDEQHSTTASVDHKPGDWVWLENDLLIITKNITAGDKYVDGSNCKKTNVHDLFTTLGDTITGEVNNLSGELQNEITARENADTTLSQQITKAIADAQQNFIDIKKAGAVGDGVADDTEVFKSVFSVGNTTIFIPEGTYKITDTVSFGDNTTVLCSGTITENVTGDNYKSAFSGINKSHIKWIGGKIVGTGAVNAIVEASCTILFDSCTDCELYGLEFVDIQNSSVVCFKSSTNCYCEKCRINKYTRTGIGALNTCNNVYLIRNSVIDCVNTAETNTYPISLSGFDFTPTESTLMGKNLNAVGNFIKNTIPHWEAIDAHGGEDVLVDGNVCIGCYSGISCFSDTGSRALTLSNARIVNNYVENGISGNVSFGKNNSCCVASGTDVVISNNIFKNGGVLESKSQNPNFIASSIYARGCENLLFENNLIVDGVGNIFDIRNVNSLVIKNNQINNCRGVPHSDSAWVFNMNASTTNKTIIAENNTGYGNTDLVLLYTHPYNTNEQYLKFINNRIDGVTLNNQENVITEQENTKSLTQGHVGDIIMKKTPTTGSPIGWICTTEWVNGANGVWTALPNL